MNCIICSETLIPTSKIYSTNCGHVFHYVCLSQWLHRSPTCPQCRNFACERTIHRLYFNSSNIDYQISTKENITILQGELQISTENNKKLQHQNAGLREQVLDLEQKQRVSKSAMHALKEKVSSFELKAKEASRLHDKIIKLKQKLKDLEHMQIVLTGSREQVNDMLRHNKDPKSLNLLVYTLKKKLTEAVCKSKLRKTKMKQLQNDVSKYRRDNFDVLEENVKLRKDIEIHKNCEAEKHCLRKKITNIETNPMPVSSQANTSAFGISRNPLPASYVILDKGDYKYNGFGGHSKREDFPKPKPNIGLKRTKSTTESAAKFEKLAPNKKLKN